MPSCQPPMKVVRTCLLEKMFFPTYFDVLHRVEFGRNLVLLSSSSEFDQQIFISLIYCTEISCNTYIIKRIIPIFSRHRHNSIFRRRVNSDTGGLKRLSKKTSRQKKEKGLETDHKDGPSERAHTLPSCVTPRATSAPTETATENVSGTPDTSPLVGEKTYTADMVREASDAESDDETSDSDNEASLTTSKLRRTHSEPAMKTMEECSQYCVTERKQRSKTFAECDDYKSDDLSCGDLRLPTWNTEITESKQDHFWSADTTESEETNSMFVDTPPDAETPPVSETPPVPQTPPVAETPPDAETLPVAETLPEVQTLPFLGTTEKQVDDASEEQHPGLTCSEDEILTREINRTANVSSAGEGNEKGPIADEVQTSATEPEGCATEAEGCATEPEGCATVGDGVELVRDDPQEVDSGEKSSGGPAISEKASSPEGDTPLSEGHRSRSRSIGDKLEAKLFLKQGRSENSENLKKVEGRGRVRRRERKSKSDLQLSDSGFVKRHTQIIEEQMLYSMLMNSERTLASLAMGIAGSDAQATEDGAPDNSEKDSTLPSEKNDKNVEEKAKNAEDDGVERSDEDSEAAKNDENDKERNSAIQSIVQEVNAEAKRDIQGQVDASRSPLPSQGNSAFDAQESDNVCIDEMAWIELTSHHGDVVKRKSAVFENASEEGNRTTAGHSCRGRQRDKETGEKLSRSPAQPREGLETESCFAPEVNEERLEIPKDDGNADVEHAQSSNARERCIDGLNHELLKLDLGELEDEEEFSETPSSSNSIVVEDYREWESSSVRDRTKILENIIAKAGGSFPSPRSRALKKEIQSPDVDDKSRRGGNRLLSTTSEIVQSREDVFLLAEDEPKGRTRSSSCPVNNSLSLNDDVINGEEMVRFLVDKFEGKKGDAIVNRKCPAI